MYQSVCSMFQTNARRPRRGFSLSRWRRRASRGSTRSSSQMVITASFIAGQAWEPRCGSPVLVPHPPTVGNSVYPRQSDDFRASATPSW